MSELRCWYKRNTKDVTAKICKLANTPKGIPRTGINKAIVMFVI